jgi:hypothetical protein
MQPSKYEVGHRRTVLSLFLVSRGQGQVLFQSRSRVGRTRSSWEFPTDRRHSDSTY